MKTIEFFSTLDGLSEVSPITLAKDYSSDWMKKARIDYLEESKRTSSKFFHIFRCPGIFDLYSTGFIISMWHDVIIKTNGDGDNFEWIIPTSDLADLTGGQTLISKQDTGLNHLMPVPPWGMGSLLKINTPWNIIAPRGLKFIMIPLVYPDTFEFQSSIGMLDPGYSSEINVQMFWNIKKGEYLLKAGTPLAHLIPLSNEKFNLVCRDATEKDKKWIRKRQLVNSFTFSIKRNLVKDLYYKHFKK